MHHPSDVVAGALLGIAALTVATFAVRAGQRAALEPRAADVEPRNPTRDAEVAT
jgi:membrane-associated phospholipid phosphatase